MRAVQCDVKTLLEGSRQFVLPLYQRRYSWAEKHWRTLADDLDRLIREPQRRSHFIGSFVSAPLDAAADQNVSRYRLIDGQQRLTTIVILLSALRDVAMAAGEEELGQEIQGLYLSNQYKKGDAAKKLLLTEQDRPDLDAVLARPAVSVGRIGEAYTFFADRLRRLPPGQLGHARQTAMGRMTVVSITLEADDDPYMIFESLNAKGERLTQADLLRNYFLMRLPQAEADEQFERLWRPMERELDRDLTEFFRHYLMRTAEGGKVRRDEVYYYAKERVDQEAQSPAEVVTKLEELRRYAWYYARLVSPKEYEPVAATAESVARLHDLKSTTAYPFLLNVLDAVADERLTPDAYAATLDLIERFLVRRLVCGVPTNELRQVFLGLCRTASEAVNTATFLSDVRASLSLGQRCPTDAAFRDALVRRPLYGGSRDLSRYILERLEREAGSETDPSGDKIQVEHVLPQTITPDWLDELAPGDADLAKELHDQWLDTLGNLTLTALNPELSNKPYQKKRDVLQHKGGFVSNKYFASVDRWDATAIEARGEAMATKAIEIWGDVAADRSASAKNGKAKPTPIVAVYVYGQRFAVARMIDAAVHVFTRLHDRDPDRFTAAVANLLPPKLRGLTGHNMHAARQVGGLWIDFHGSSKALRNRCVKLIDLMDLPESTVAFEPA